MASTMWRCGGALVVSLAAIGLTAPSFAATCADAVQEFSSAHGLAPTLPPKAAPGAGTSGPAGAGAADLGTSGGMPGNGPGSGPGSIPDSGPGSGSGLSPQALNESGGVIRPPSTGDLAVIEPPHNPSNAMPTAPDLSPNSGSSADQPSGGALGRAAREAQVESLITAARSAAASGDEARCLDSLGEARRLAAPDGSAGGTP